MNMSKKNIFAKSFQAGFTIVELLVVISVIAVLASVVLFNVTPYIAKAKNAAIKANLSTVLTNSTFYFDSNTSYSGFCATALFTNPQDSITSSGGTAMCNVNVTGNAVCACSTQVGSNLTFCVDHTGTKIESATPCASECPAVSASCQ